MRPRVIALRRQCIHMNANRPLSPAGHTAVVHALARPPCGAHGCEASTYQFQDVAGFCVPAKEE